MNRKSALLLFAVVIIAAIALNIKVPTRQGVNYTVSEHRIPLYVKIIEFIDRDYRYRSLAREITEDEISDTGKMTAILKWTTSNIRTDPPRGWPVYDDHILNIIIRGYGQADQVNDVFATLCSYAHLDAGWGKFYIPGRGKGLVLSFVKISGSWRVIDAARNKYFLNKDGDIASIEDIASDRYDKISAGEIAGMGGETYEDYFSNMGRALSGITSRAKKQMPFQRMLYEVKKIFADKKGR